MTERCASCGTELFTGQQFCRRCGTPTRAFTSGDIPTRILPGGGARPQPDPRPGETTPLPHARPTDEAVYPPRAAGHRPPRAAARRSRRGLVLALLAVLCVSVGASVFIARQITLHWAGKRKRSEPPVKVVVPKAAAPGVAAPPPAAPAGGHAAASGVKEAPLDEDDAEVSGGETVITESFSLDEGQSFAVKNVAGDISVEGWDGEEVEVRITKRGGTPAERAAVPILHSNSPRWQHLTTRADGRSGVRDVRYEIKLPRGLRQMDIVSTDSNVRVRDVDANIAIDVMRGDISLEDVAGTISTRTAKGDTKVAFAAADPSEPVILNGVNGDVEVLLRPDANADVKAETVDGRVEADGPFKLDVQRRLRGAHAAGRLGKGGQPIVLKTVSGNIKIR